MLQFHSYWNRVKAVQIILLTLVVMAFSADVMAGGRSVTRSRTGDSFHRSGMATGPRGNTVTRQTQGVWDQQAGTWNKSVTTTGPDGQSAQRSSTATRTEDGYTRNSTVTGPQGNTATRQTQGYWDPETKTWVKSVTLTGNQE
jgi:hypothetical protein